MKTTGPKFTFQNPKSQKTLLTRNTTITLVEKSFVLCYNVIRNFKRNEGNYCE